MSKWNQTGYMKKSAQATSYFTSPSYKTSNPKLVKMYKLDREKILNSLLKDNKYINVTQGDLSMQYL